ncbi:MAG: hypothetical protein IT458_09845 [Planctomycetes bacterium]|nr:hypothetical protein [Planctomycetota bacterium]
MSFRPAQTAFLLPLLLAAPVVAQKSTLKRALPEGTILMVTMPDLDATMAKIDQVPLMRMWKEGEVQDFFAEARKRLDQEWKQALMQAAELHKQGVIPFAPEELMKLRVHGMSAALTKLGVEQTGSGPMPSVGIVLHLEMGESMPIWKKVLDYGMGQLEARAQGMLTRSESKVGDLTLVSLQTPFSSMSLNWAYVGSGLVFGTLPDEVKSVLGALAGNKDVLTASANYKAAAKHVSSQGAEMEFFFQPGPVFDFAMQALRLAAENAPDFPPELDIDGVERAIDALGLRSIVSMAGTFSYENGRSVGRSFTHAPQPQRKGFFAGSHRPLDMSFLPWVPKDAVSVSASTFDVTAIYDGLMAAVKAYDPKVHQHLEAMMKPYEEQIGVNLREDLFGALGDSYVAWSMPMATITNPPEGAYLVKVKDQERLLKALNALTKMSQGVVSLDSVDRQGTQMHVLRLRFEELGGMGGGGGLNMLGGFSPTFAFKKDFLVAGFSGSDVKRALDRMDRAPDAKDGKGDVRNNAEFSAFLAKMPKEGIEAVSFTDWKSTFEGYYQGLTSVLAFLPIDNDEIPLDLQLLPDQSSLTKHLFGAMGWTRSDGEGFTSYSEGPWGPETLILIGGTALGVGATMGMRSAMEMQPQVRVRPAPGRGEPGTQPQPDKDKEEAPVEGTGRRNGK